MSPALLLIQDMAGGQQADIVFPGLNAVAGKTGGKRERGSDTQICSARMAYHLEQGPRQQQQQQQKETSDPDRNKAKVKATH